MSACAVVTATGVCELGPGTSFAAPQADKTNRGMRINGIIIDPLGNSGFFMASSYS
jgi:hypothetical protein